MAAAFPIQAMDATTLKAVLSELRPVIVPSRFEKAQQPDGRTLQLGLRSLEGMHWLELSWLAEAPRLLAIPSPPRQGEGSTLARQLQHGLRGLALTAIEQHGWERVVGLQFAPRPQEPPRRTLLLELMGRHSNLFLLDEERRVIAIGRQVRPEQSRRRPIGSGDAYSPPPPLSGDPPRRSELPARWRRRISLQPLPLTRALREAYQGISPALARQLCEGVADGDLPVTDLTPCQWERLWHHWQRWLDSVEQEAFRLRWGGVSDYRCWDGPGAGAVSAGPSLALNRALAGYYGERLGYRRREERRHSLRQRLGEAIGREQRSLAAQQALLDQIPASDGLQRRADALLSRPDPGRERIEEAQKLYRRARKLRRSAAVLRPRLEEHRQRRAALEESLAYLEMAGSIEELEALEKEIAGLLGPRGAAPARGRAERRRALPQPLELHTASGLRLQVGRNHGQNEWISLRQARPGDLWFHAQECPGSHVVLKASEGRAAEEDLSAAADLAALFSRARGNRRVPVVMVPTQALQRIPGAAPGTVCHRGGEVLWGEPGRARSLLNPA